MSENVSVDMSQHFYRASAADFMKVPGGPVAYWMKKNIRNAFQSGTLLKNISPVAVGLQTGDNDRFLRLWHEVSGDKIGLNMKTAKAAQESCKKWFPYNKGGEFRKWYGNNDYVVNWENNGYEIRNFTNNSGKLRSRPQNIDYYFKPAITWSFISSAYFGVRYSDAGAVFDVAGSSAFPISEDISWMTGFLCSKQAFEFMKTMNPTLNFQVGNVSSLPLLMDKISEIKQPATQLASELISIHRNDWDSYETSWSFSKPKLGISGQQQSNLANDFKLLREKEVRITIKTKELEEENNRIFIDAYGLEDELTPNVPLNEITLTCNPHYRYRGDLTEQEREDRLQSDTIAELISYAIGCMMGRYSLDRDGLVYANENNDGFAELVAEGAYKSFAADGDGILALTAEEWFEEDIANRFSEFLAQIWGEDSLQQNIDFVAQSLCLYALKARSGETAMEVIRRYLSTQFFKDHMSMYKRRPIYWLFSSGRHKAFECLVYLHRYNESTLARMRTEYVIPHTARLSAYATRLAARIEAADSTAERNRLNREQKKIHDQQAELAAFDEQLRHAADQRIQLDLDDGVKVNYGKFGDLLAERRAIAGK